MGLRIFLRDRINFAAKTEFEIVLEFFCRIEVGLRIFLSKEKREEKVDRENFSIKKQKGRKGVGLEIICPSKKGEEEYSKASQKRSEESRPLSGKTINDRVRFPDPLQNTSMLPFDATNEKWAGTTHGWQLEPIGKKLLLESFCKNYLCNSNGLFLLSAFILFFICTTPQKGYFKLINHLSIN